MAFDGFFLSGIVRECQILVGGRLSKIYQPHNDELHLLIYSRRNNFRLVISASASNCRFHLTQHETSNPVSPPMFCMLLRKHLEGGRIIAITQTELERIATIIIESRDELGNLVHRSLIAEIMGRHSNIVLVEKSTNKIIDAIKRLPLGVSRHRQILPGLKYVTPPSFDKINPLTVDLLDIPPYPQAELAQTLLDTYQGISPFLAKELAYRAGSVKLALQLLQNISSTAMYHPCTCSAENKLYLSALNPTHMNAKCQEFNTLNEACDSFYVQKDTLAKANTYQQRLSKVINARTKIVQRKLDKQQRAWDKSLKADQYKRKGDLIKANLYLIEEGRERVQVIDYFDENLPHITLDLNPHKSPQHNLRMAYAKYEKAIRTQKALRKQLSQTKEELSYLESLSWHLKSAQSISDFKELETELQETGYLHEIKGQERKEIVKPAQPQRFNSSEGQEILVGRNNKQNDHLTLRLAHKEDIWLHCKDTPSAHTIIRCAGKPVGEQSLYEAACLTAYYSKARYSSNVPVDYTLVKNVRKPRKAKPGMVIYDNHRTLYVTPDETLVDELRK